jgi:hypothetical protein
VSYWLKQGLWPIAGNVAQVGLFGGGVSTNVIQYVTIASTGNATDFGDLLTNTPYLAACSNAHGGL